MEHNPGKILLRRNLIRFSYSKSTGEQGNQLFINTDFQYLLLLRQKSIINNGVAQACAKDGFLRRSLTTYKGYLTHEETSAIQGRPWVRPEDILEIADQKLDLAPSTTKSHSDNFIKLEK
mgnify:FL=1